VRGDPLKLPITRKGITQVVLTDWFELAGTDRFEMMTYRYGTVPQLFELDAALKDKVEAWVERLPNNTDPQSEDWIVAWVEAQELCGLI